MASLTNGTRRFMLDSLCSEDRESELLSGLSFSEAYIPSFLLNEEKRPVPVEQSSTNEAGGAAMAYRTPKANMAMLSNQSDQFRPEAASLVLSIRSAEDSVSDEGKIGVYAQRLSIYKTNTGASCVAWTIGGCFVGYVVALLVFFTRFYQKTIVPWILEILQPYLEPYQTKEDVAAFVYLLCSGVVPMVVAFTLWQARKDTILTSAACQSERVSCLLRRKPACWSRLVPASDDPSDSKSSPSRVPRVYLNATWGEIGFMLLLLAIDTFIFNQVLVRDEISSLSTSAEMCRAMGKSCGYICLFTMLWLLLLMTKDSFWREFFHLPYPLGMKYRRWLGTLTLMFAVLHAVCHAVSLYLRHELIAQLVPHFGAMYKVIPIRDANGVNAFGEVALVAMVLMTAVSIPVIRKKFYAWYLSAQQILGTIVVLAVCVHFQMALWWLFPALLLFIMQKVVAGSHARYPVEIVDMAPLPNGMTRLICKRSKDAHAFTAGQFVYLYASRISWFQWHPFYVASGPRAHDDTFKVYVQAAGDWTDSFFDLSKLAYATQEAPAIYADGFYGPSHSSYYEQYGCVVLFAEGIGATGVIAMLEELFLSAKRSTAGTDVDGTHTQVWFLWVCQDVCLFKEFEPLLMEIRAWDPREKHFRLRLFLTKVPTLMEIKYTCPPPCNFVLSDTKSESKNDGDCGAQGHVADMETGEKRQRPPQNKSGCFRFRSQPFHAALAMPLLKVFGQISAVATTVAFAVHVEWQDHVHGSGIFGGDAEEEDGIFRPLHRIACVVVVLLGCFSVYIVIGCEELMRWVLRKRTVSSRPRQQTYDMDCDRLAPSSTAWTEMNSLRSNPQTLTMPPSTTAEQESTARVPEMTEPDILEKLRILSLEPDLDQFMASVAKCYYAYAAEPIGVFACGAPAFVTMTEAAVETAKELDGQATYYFHRMDFQV